MRELSGRIGVVTGAASGIGLATARRFAEEGMKVVLADLELGPLQEAEKLLTEADHDVIAVPTDVSEWEQVEHLAARTLEHYGAVHVVHNNAGVVTSGPIWDLAIEDWEWVLGVNLWGVIHGIKAFVPHIRAAGEGHVVNTASVAGLVASATIGPYNASKFGVVALSETLLNELRVADPSIGVTVVCPGATNTRIVESDRNRDARTAKAHRTSPEEKGFIAGSTAMLAKGKDPAEVADLIVDAIRENRFWLVTHPGWNPILRKRMDALLEDGRLEAGFAG